jgi:integrase
VFQLSSAGSGTGKGGKRHEMPWPPQPRDYLIADHEKTGIADDLKDPLFRTIGRGTHELTRMPLPTANTYMMIKRRAAEVGLETKIGNHRFHATAITAYLKNGGALEGCLNGEPRQHPHHSAL